jgi:deoxyribose-phosphate aldolase
MIFLNKVFNTTCLIYSMKILLNIMIKKWDSFKKVNENKKSILDSSAMNKIDYYYLDDSVDLSIVREKYNLIEDNAYRAFATFGYNIKHFLELPCEKIALVNYPPKSHTKRNLIKEIDSVKELDIDEIEFPWSDKYLLWDIENWRKIVLDCSNKGIKLRAMLEIGIQSDESIVKSINFLREIGIYSIMTSSGLISDITTIERWNSIKSYIPRLFEVKVVGILTLSDINNFIKSGADLSATTIDLKVNYKQSEIDDYNE